MKRRTEAGPVASPARTGAGPVTQATTRQESGGVKDIVIVIPLSKWFGARPSTEGLVEGLLRWKWAVLAVLALAAAAGPALSKWRDWQLNQELVQKAWPECQKRVSQDAHAYYLQRYGRELTVQPEPEPAALVLDEAVGMYRFSGKAVSTLSITGSFFKDEFLCYVAATGDPAGGWEVRQFRFTLLENKPLGG